MRSLLLATAVLCLAVPFSTADDATTVKEIVDRAVLAHAESGERLSKLKRVQFKSKGIWKTVVGEVTATREIRAEWPDRPEYFALAVDAQTPNGKVQMQLIVEGLTKCRQIVGSLSKELPSEETSWLAPDVYAYWVASLVPLRDGGLTLSPLPPTKIDGIAVVGIKAEKRNRPTVELYFDAKTHLLAKIAYPGLEAGVSVRKELTYSDYKEFGGIKMPTKETEWHDGRRRYDWVNSEFSFPDKIDRK